MCVYHYLTEDETKSKDDCTAHLKGDENKGYIFRIIMITIISAFLSISCLKEVKAFLVIVI